MNYLVAVSGGVDSVALLDMLSKTDHHLIVAHVDHGIRGEESAADARFVKALAGRYGLPFVTTELHLGAGASEDVARRGRYRFLFEQAAHFHATIVTAHHLDDLVETVSINLERGTGWRGLAVLDRPGLHRPLLALPKVTLYEYAIRHKLEWVDDATNRSDAYRRNRVRMRLAGAMVDRERVAELRTRQLQLRQDIDREAARLIARHGGSRHFLAQLDEVTAMEVLGTEISLHTSTRPMHPQLSRALIAVKTAKPGTLYQVGSGVELDFTPRKYTVRVV